MHRIELPTSRRALRKTAAIALTLGMALAMTGPAAAQTPPNAPQPVVQTAIQMALSRLMAAPQIKTMLQSIEADHARSVAETRTITEIPAPPFKEAARAAYMQRRLSALGLSDVRIDSEGNVLAWRKGSGAGPTLVVTAHMDTVFPEGTDVKVKEGADGRLSAPGIRDNSRGLASLLGWAKALQDNGVRTVGDLLFVASVGEEELGDLRGMKALFRSHPGIDGMVALDGTESNRVTVGGTGSHRHEVSFSGPGGHSFGAFGLVPSAIHAMGRAIAKIGDLRPPSFPKTTFTVGTVGGGTSVNTIAGDARMAIDIRSDSPANLLELERQIMAAIAEGVDEENKRWGKGAITFKTKLVGDRPAGRTDRDSAIVQTAMQVVQQFGKSPGLTSASTDANWPMSLGIPAIVMGSGGESQGAHTLTEWWKPEKAYDGVQISLMTILGLVGVQGVSEPLLEKRKGR